MTGLTPNPTPQWTEPPDQHNAQTVRIQTGQSCGAAVYGRRMNVGRVANLIVQLLLSLWVIGFVLGLLPGGSNNPWVAMAFLVGTIAFFWTSARFHKGEEM